MIPPPTRNLTLLEMIVLQTYWVGLSFMWSSLHIIILPAVLLHLVPENYKNTYLGLLTFVGLIIAMIVQPISGAFSDRWKSRWGRRRPLVLLGTSFDFLFLAILGWAGGLWWLVVGYIGLQFSSNIAHGPLQGLQPDRVPPRQMGSASGLKNLMDMVGLVIASLVMGRFLDPDVRQPVAAISLVAVVLLAGALVTLLGVREQPSLAKQDPERPHPEPEQDSGAASASQPVLPSDRPSASYWWLIASRFAFLLGIYDIQVFAQYYVRDVLAAPNPVKLTGDLMAAITLALIAFALVGGWLGDRLGHKRVLVIASLIGAAGCLLMLLARTPGTLLVYGSVLGAGTGLFLTANWALANQLAPYTQAGKYLGLTNLATAGAGAVGRLAGPLIDLLNNARPGDFWGYSMLFLFGAACLLVSAGLLRWISIPGPLIPPLKFSFRRAHE